MRLDPHGPDQHAIAAALADCRGRAEDCLAAAERGLSRDPRHAECLRLRGRALRTLGRPDAGAAIAAALAVDPEDRRALREFGQLRRDRGDAAGAAEVFLAAVRRDPGDAESRGLLHDALRARHAPYRWVIGLFEAANRRVERWGVAGGVAVAVAAGLLVALDRALVPGLFDWAMLGVIGAAAVCGVTVTLFQLGLFDRLPRGDGDGRYLPGFRATTGFTWRKFGRWTGGWGTLLLVAVAAGFLLHPVAGLCVMLAGLLTVAVRERRGR